MKITDKRRAEIELVAAMSVDEVMARLTSDDFGTPADICKALGYFDLDPCSNSRSLVQSTKRYVFELELLARECEAMATEVSDNGTLAARLHLHAIMVRARHHDMAMPQIDGATARWSGSVFCNPPYSNPLPWCERLAAHGDPWVALVKLDTTTRWWATLMESGASWAPFKHRLKFIQPGKDMTANFASALLWSRWRPSPEMAAHLWMKSYARAA